MIEEEDVISTQSIEDQHAHLADCVWDLLELANAITMEAQACVGGERKSYERQCEWGLIRDVVSIAAKVVRASNAIGHVGDTGVFGRVLEREREAVENEDENARPPNLG